MNTQDIWNFITTQGVDFGIKLLTAIVAWIIGRWLINLAVGLIGKAFRRGGKIDATLAHYLKSIIAIVLNIIMILAILDIFGIRTTSFAALLAGAGLVSMVNSGVPPRMKAPSTRLSSDMNRLAQKAVQKPFR